VKPQFEVGRQRLGAGGVVRDPALRLAALRDVATAARELGLRLAGAVASPLPGPSGNVEYFLCLRRDREDVGDGALLAAVAAGPP
jgi:23S rRNA (cytidine1920-2'-O)/16S rRNA (cytidine1409-2'-O)-methyltransferase